MPTWCLLLANPVRLWFVATPSGVRLAISKTGCAGWVVAGVLALALVGRCGEQPADPLAISGNPKEAELADAAPTTAKTLSRPMYVSSRTLNCRETGSTNGEVVERLSRNDYVLVESEDAGWSRLSRRTSCWVKSEYLSSVRQTEPVPATETYAAPRRFSGGSGGAFRNCSAARAAGAAPVYADEPGYGAHLDRDGDGVGCE